MEMIKNKKILALIGIVSLMAGTFFPYLTFSLWGYSESITLWGYWEGKVILGLVLANALFIFKDWIEKYLPQLFNNNIGRLVEKANNPKFSLVPTILIAGFAIYMLTLVEADGEYIKYGLGFWLLWIGIVSLIGHAIFYKKQNKTEIETQIPPQTIPTPTPTVTPIQPQPEQPQSTINYQQPQPQQSMEQPTMPSQNYKFCTQCGNQVDASSTICPNCGNNF